MRVRYRFVGEAGSGLGWGWDLRWGECGDRLGVSELYSPQF